MSKSVKTVRRSLNWRPNEVENTPPKENWKVKEAPKADPNSPLKVVFSRSQVGVEAAPSSREAISPRKRALKEKQISSLLDSEDEHLEPCFTPTRRSKRVSIEPLKEKFESPSRTLRDRRAAPKFYTLHESDCSEDDFEPEVKRKRFIAAGKSLAIPLRNSALCSRPASASKVPRPKKTAYKNRKAKSDIESESDSDSSPPPAILRNKREAQRKRVMTPKIPERHIPLASFKSPLQEAQLRLHVSAVPDNLPCREEEFAEIYAFVQARVQDGLGGCMYISGVPGTGKTATVKEVIRQLQSLEGDGDMPHFDFIEINGMRLTEPNQSYVQIWKAISNGEKVTSEYAKNLLEKRFTTGDKSAKAMTVLLVDELDMLWNRKQSVLYNLFDWPTHKTARLVVLAIANTMDLPERVMINRVSSRVGLTRLTFSPYNHQQLQQIVATRLSGLTVFDKDAIQLVARKVASLSGDARRALDICRRAVEIAQADRDSGRPASASISTTSPRKKCTLSRKPKEVPTTEDSLVTLKHVTLAHQEMFCSPKILAVRHCSDLEKLFLRCVIQIFLQTGIEEASLVRIFRTTNELLVIEGKSKLLEPDLHALIGRMAATRILLVEPGKCGRLDMKVRLGISQDDIAFALQDKKTND